MYQAGLVLEGGGMKGIYTAGVLEFFLEKEIWMLCTRKATGMLKRRDGTGLGRRI